MTHLLRLIVKVFVEIKIGRLMNEQIKKLSIGEIKVRLTKK